MKVRGTNYRKKARIFCLAAAALAILMIFPVTALAQSAGMNPAAADAALETAGIKSSWPRMSDIFSSQEEQTADSSKKVNAFYKQLRKCLLKRRTSFELTYEGSYSDIHTGIYEMLEKVRAIDDKSTSDDSDFLIGSILKFGYQSSYTSSSAKITFKAEYADTAAQIKKVNKKVASILKSNDIEYLSDFQKIKKIYDIVIKKLSYDNTRKDHSVYGGLIAKKHTTVCQGYALLIYKMLTDAGIKTHYVSGTADGQDHAWNIVKLKGKWYHLDATWDDRDSDLTKYDYFLSGSASISRDHRLDEIYNRTYAISLWDYDW